MGASIQPILNVIHVQKGDGTCSRCGAPFGKGVYPKEAGQLVLEYEGPGGVEFSDYELQGGSVQCQP